MISSTENATGVKMRKGLTAARRPASCYGNVNRNKLNSTTNFPMSSEEIMKQQLPSTVDPRTLSYCYTDKPEVAATSAVAAETSEGYIHDPGYLYTDDKQKLQQLQLQQLHQQQQRLQQQNQLQLQQRRQLQQNRQQQPQNQWCHDDKANNNNDCFARRFSVTEMQAATDSISMSAAGAFPQPAFPDATTTTAGAAAVNVPRYGGPMHDQLLQQQQQQQQQQKRVTFRGDNSIDNFQASATTRR